MQDETMTLEEALLTAVTLHQKQQLDEAEALYRAILAQFPDYPDALHFLGLLMYHRGDHEQAIEWMERAIAIFPAYADAYNNLGNIFNLQGDFQKAADNYRKALEINPANASAHNNLGIVLKHLTEYTEAAEAFLKAIELAPDNPDLYRNLGSVYRRHGQFSESAKAYQKAISLRGYNAHDYERLCRSLHLEGNFGKVIEVVKEWLERDPTNPLALHRMSSVTGENVPPRASDDYVSQTFDSFAETFDYVLKGLEYQAPFLILDAIQRLYGEESGDLSVLDAGCGTGLCGPLVRPFANRLVGVDLSAKMLERAGDRGCYDQLLQAELTAYIASHSAVFDLIVSADTLVYFGDLHEICHAAAGALTNGGCLVFTVENAEPDLVSGFKINPHGRFAHTEEYVRAALNDAGMAVVVFERVTLRNEGGKPVHGFLVAATTGTDERR